MNDKSLEVRIVEALEAIERHLAKFVNEGITIYQHCGGDEEKN